MKKEFYQKEKAKQFYEQRYERGYMEAWPVEKKQRVFEIISDLNLPEYGDAIDFGCGNGVFTEVLQQALPKWNIFGSDVSEKAIENAKKRFPNCSFFVSDNERITHKKFDFLFSHHVLEHVFDIKKTISEVNDLLKPTSGVLHIFPCGNENSLEQKVCKMRIDGINEEMENRFFYEDMGHIRRLTTQQTSQLMEAHGFSLTQDFYSHQYYAAIKWLTQSSSAFILNFTNPQKAINSTAKQYLFFLRLKLLLLFVLQKPAVIFNRIRLNNNKLIRHYLIGGLIFIPFLFSYPFYSLLNHYAKKEWDTNKRAKNGSEMYLFYSRK